MDPTLPVRERLNRCRHRGVKFLMLQWRLTGEDPGTQRRCRKSRPAGAVAGAVTGLGALLATGVGAAEEIQDLAGIKLAVESFVAAQAPTLHGERTIEVGRLDPRLRLSPCDGALSAFFPPGAQRGSNRTVGVSCPGPKPWTIYLSVRIRYFGTVLVAARALRRGTVLQASELALEERDLQTGPFGYLSDVQDALGKRVTRPVAAGAPISEAYLEAPPVVARGQQVLLVAETPYMRVRMTGIAMEDGAAGDRIRVRNKSSQRVVEGRVEPGGLVRVDI
jgi:flagella basal body P-ring formation protein FlgA